MTVRHLISKARLHSPLTFVTYPPATDEEDWTNDYPIAPKYKDHLEEIAPRWRATPLPAFDMSGKLIKIPELEFSLRGSLVLVYFELRHYPIRNKRTNGISGNTFSATATQVKVLERGAGRRSSLTRASCLKGQLSFPNHPPIKRIRQTPSRPFTQVWLFVLFWSHSLISETAARASMLADNTDTVIRRRNVHARMPPF